MKWFKHDSDAHNDAKLDKVLMHYGSHGYAVYFYCIELIAGKLDKNNTSCALEHDAEQIGARLKIDSVEVTAILQYLVDIGLFERQIEQSITCLKLLGRLDKSMTNSPQLRQMIEDYRQGESGNVMTHHDTSGNVTPEQIRTDKKRKRIGAKAPSRQKFQPPSREEVRDYLVERGATEHIAEAESAKLIDHYEANGWRQSSGLTIKSWRHTASAWLRRRVDFGSSPNQLVAGRDYT